MRAIEVYITNTDTSLAHALQASIEEAMKQSLWVLDLENRLPNIPALKHAVRQYRVSPKRITSYETTFDTPAYEEVSYNHSHTMGRAILTTSLLGFMLRNLDHEFCARFTDEILLADPHAKVIGSPGIANRTKLGAHIGEGNKHFLKYLLTGRVYLLV
jgi:hypothetical protein